MLHHNLLLPLQDRLRQPDGQVGIDPPDPEEEEEEDSGLLCASGTPHTGWKGPSSSQIKPTKPSEASKQDALMIYQRILHLPNLCLKAYSP